MNLKKTLLVILAFVSCMFALMLVSSYAWYSYVNGSTAFDVVTNNEDINVTYTSGMYIDTKTAVPIKKEEVDEYSEKNKFSIELNDDDLAGKILVDVSLIDIEMDDLLKIEDFKYDLLYNGFSVGSGNFADFDGVNLKMGTGVVIDSVYNNDFELRLYILDNNEDQNNLMNRTFKGTISVNVVSRLKSRFEQKGVDILIKNIKIDSKDSNSLPVNGAYNMTYTCDKGSILSWDSIARVITFESGSKIKDSCSLNFVKSDNYNYQMLNKMPVGSYVKYKGVGGRIGDKVTACRMGASYSETIEDSSIESVNSCAGSNPREDMEDEKGVYGYCTSSSFKYLETGWRIAYIENGKVALISAGAPECILVDNNVKTNADTRALKYCNPKYVDNNCTCVDDDADGLCDSKSLDAWAISNDDFKNITRSISGVEKNISGNVATCFNAFSDTSCGYNNSLLDNGGTYIFSDISNDNIVWLKRHVTVDDKNKTYGLRPIVSLSRDVKVIGGTGTMEDPYIIFK